MTSKTMLEVSLRFAKERRVVAELFVADEELDLEFWKKAVSDLEYELSIWPRAPRFDEETGEIIR